jgi:hypothetical protein
MTFSVLFSTFLVFFQETSQNFVLFLNFFVLFEQIYFKKVNYFFEQLQKLKKKVKGMSFFYFFFTFLQKSTKKH